MRIILSCLQALRPHPLPAYEFWDRYFKRGLEEAGHEWLEVPGVDWAEALLHRGEALEQWRARTWTSVVGFVAREHLRRPIDLFLGYLFPAQLDAEGIGAIRKVGVPCVNFFCDNVRWFRFPPAVYSAFDLHWVPEKKAVSLYRAAGMRALYAPMPCWVAPELRETSAVERFPPTFVGSRDCVREDLFAAALLHGAAFDIRGRGWANNARDSGCTRHRSLAAIIGSHASFIGSEGWVPWLRRLGQRIQPRPDPQIFTPVVREAPAAGEYETVLRESMVTIGVSRYGSFRHPGSQPDSYSRLRDIEAPMLGACYLTEWTEGLDDLYEPGSEIETYRTPEELAAKLAALRADPARRTRLRRAGQRRALSEHTVARTITRIGHELGR